MKRIKIKHALLLTLCVAFSISVHAQRFEWATTIDGYDVISTNVGNEIVGSMTDRDGNLYICSRYGYSASLCNVSLPDASSLYNMLVAKISPSGELVWHKEVYGFQYVGINGMEPLGDTAMMVCFSVTEPGYNEWLEIFGTRYGDQYHSFDSLFVGKDTPTFSVLNLTCFATINLEGEVAEMHWLARTFLDADGNPITRARQLRNPSPADWQKLLAVTFNPATFTVDHEGDIIFTLGSGSDLLGIVDTNDTTGNPNRQISTWDGGIGGMRYYVDGRHVYDYHVPFQAEQWNVQMLKFTPDMDSVVFCRYVAYDTVGQGVASASTDNLSMYHTQDLTCDEDGNIFLCGTVEAPGYGEFLGRISIWDSVEQCSHTVEVYDTTYFRDILLDTLLPNLHIHTQHGQNYNGYLLKYAPDGTLLWLHQPQFERLYRAHMYIDEPNGGCLYNSLLFDSTDSSLYILAEFSSGFAFDTVHNVNTYFGPGDTAQHRYKGAGFVHLRASDGSYLGSGCVPASDGSNAPGTLAVQENHVVMQVTYDRQLTGVDTVYQHNWTGDNVTLAMVHFDNEGHVLGVVDFGNNDATSRSGQCILHDSILYMNGCISSSAFLGDLTLYANRNMGYIIKYVDTSFLPPHIPHDTTHTDPIDTGHVSLALVGDKEAFVVYPNPFRQRITIRSDNASPITSAWLTDMQGRCEEVKLTAVADDQYTLDITTHPQATYLLTLVTSDGTKHTIRLLKQSE